MITIENDKCNGDKARLPSPAQLDELFQERRSIRFFQVDKIERAHAGPEG